MIRRLWNCQAAQKAATETSVATLPAFTRAPRENIRLSLLPLLLPLLLHSCCSGPYSSASRRVERCRIIAFRSLAFSFARCRPRDYTTSRYSNGSDWQHRSIHRICQVTLVCIRHVLHGFGATEHTQVCPTKQHLDRFIRFCRFTGVLNR